MGNNTMAPPPLTPEYIEEKLVSFDKKLDSMVKAIITLARVEERQVFHSQEIAGYKKDMNNLYRRINSVETALTINTTKLSVGEKVWWIITTAIITSIGAIGVHYGIS